MNPLHPSPIFFNHGPSWSNDVEMLQTDVMRFFAILCLCLMAIFALVKTLPMGPPPDKPTIEKSTDLKAEAEALRNQIIALKATLAETHNKLQMARIDAEQSSEQVSRAEETEHALLARVAKARHELEQISQSLNGTEHKIEIRDMKLAKIVGDIAAKRRIRAELKSQINMETQNLSKIRKELDQAKEKLAPSIDQNQAGRDRPPQAALQPEHSEKGFSLRFASDAALEVLITRRQVGFYVIAGKKGWQLKVTAGRPVFISTQIPREIYEMEVLTVPISYVSEFQRQVAAFGRNKVTWGVTLPTQTISSINQQVGAGQGGELVIMDDGEVNLK